MPRGRTIFEAAQTKIIFVGMDDEGSPPQIRRVHTL
jgi:hypothetical protein